MADIYRVFFYLLDTLQFVQLLYYIKRLYETFTDRSTHLRNLFGALKCFPLYVPEDHKLYTNGEQNCLHPFALLLHTHSVSSDCLVIQYVVSLESAERGESSGRYCLSAATLEQAEN
jgi:hypothetical protein